jgi:hypothetical protein
MFLLKGKCKEDWIGWLHIGPARNSVGGDLWGIGGSIGSRYLYVCWNRR